MTNNVLDRPREVERSSRLRDSPRRVRVRSLDGLRGVAALIVLLHHLSLTIPAVSSGYDDVGKLSPFSWAWWAVASPVKIFVAGPEFVLVFFVLSGFVLTLSPLAKDAYDWASYYPRRILRIGIPVIASLLLAVALIVTLPRPAGQVGDSSWLARQAHPNISLSHLLGEALLIVEPNRPSVNSSLWSLTWEMWFSLLLPIAVLVALWSRRLPLLWALLFCAVSAYGYLANIPAAMFLPAFGLGALLGANADRIQVMVARWRPGRHVTVLWLVFAVTGPMLSISYWMLRPVLSSPLSDLAVAMRVPGAAMMVATVAFWPGAARLFERKPLAVLGRVSFSLYLVQAPLAIGIGLAFTGQPWWIGAAITVVACSVATALMYRFVEKPSQGLASRAGRGTSRRWTALKLKLGAQDPPAPNTQAGA